jgi:hypothetical protein
MMPQMGTLSISESEWMRRTPSPAQPKPAGRLWSPRLGKKATGIFSEENRRGGIHSDTGPLSSKEVTNKDGSGDLAEENPTHAVDAEMATSADTSGDGVTQHLAKQGSHSRNTWESCRELPSRGYDADDRPVSNWI